MNPKPKSDDEFRMPVDDFDRMMRGALSAPAPEPKKPARKRVAKPIFKKPEHLRMSDAEYDRYMTETTAKTVAKIKRVSASKTK